jgi:hypothetical protein
MLPSRHWAEQGSDRPHAPNRVRPLAPNELNNARLKGFIAQAMVARNGLARD